MRTYLTLAFLALGCLALTTPALGEDNPAAGCTCPVSDEPAQPTVTATYLGKTVYLCCENCLKAFNADSAKYAAKANHQLVQTGQAIQVACPISGSKLNSETMLEVAGVKLAFCCEQCQAKAASVSGEAQLALCFADLSKAFTTQTACPVGGKPINPKCSIKHNGKRVFFCCGKCLQAFSDNPNQYESKLPLNF